MKPVLWGDAFRLFHELLNDFQNLLLRARDLNTTDPDEPMTLRAAVIGFSLFYPMVAWSRDNFLFIDNYLTGEPPLDSFNHVEGGSEAVTVFGCLCLGAMLGKFNAGEIQNDDAVRGEWYMMAFMSSNNEEICSNYREFMDNISLEKSSES